MTNVLAPSPIHHVVSIRFLSKSSWPNIEQVMDMDHYHLRYRYFSAYNQAWFMKRFDAYNFQASPPIYTSDRALRYINLETDDERRVTTAIAKPDPTMSGDGTTSIEENPTIPVEEGSITSVRGTMRGKTTRSNGCILGYLHFQTTAVYGARIKLADCLNIHDRELDLFHATLPRCALTLCLTRNRDGWIENPARHKRHQSACPRGDSGGYGEATFV